MDSSFLFIITPDAILTEAALVEFEGFLRLELGLISIHQRNVQGQTNRVYRGSDPDGKPQFLWLMQVDFVGGSGGSVGSALPTAIDQAKATLKGRATLSTGFKLIDLPV